MPDCWGFHEAVMFLVHPVGNKINDLLVDPFATFLKWAPMLYTLAYQALQSWPMLGAVIASATGGSIALPFGLSAGMLPAIGSAAGMGAFCRTGCGDTPTRRAGRICTGCLRCVGLSGRPRCWNGGVRRDSRHGGFFVASRVDPIGQ